MTAYAPTSTIGRLDLDSAASDRVATLLRALDEPATLDLLGFGVARDALSGLLSPGTSTIETRLRYFLFRPWIVHDLARHRSTSDTATERLRTSEVRLPINADSGEHRSRLFPSAYTVLNPDPRRHEVALRSIEPHPAAGLRSGGIESHPLIIFDRVNKPGKTDVTQSRGLCLRLWIRGIRPNG